MFIFVILLGWNYKTSWTFYNTDNCILTFDSGWNSEVSFVLYRYFVYVISTFCAFKLLCKFYYVISNRIIKNAIVIIGQQTLFLYVAHVAILALFAKYIVKMFAEDGVVFHNFSFVRYYLVATVCTCLITLLLYYIAFLLKKVKSIYLIKFLGIN